MHVLRTGGDRRRLAVVLHDIEPATLGHCALIREWLGDLGVDRATLGIVRRSPALALWLDERLAAGDAVAHQGGRPARGEAIAPSRRWSAAPRFPVVPGRGAMRVDLRPTDFDRSSGRIRAMERALRRAAAAREVVTLDDLAPAAVAAAPPGLRTDALA